MEPPPAAASFSCRPRTRAEVRELDRRAIEEHGVPSILLMENAGRACADEVQRELAGRAGPVSVLCGPGNNGGDGFVIARTLVNRGLEARVLFLGAPTKLEGLAGDPGTNPRLWRGLGGEVRCLQDVGAVQAAGAALAQSAVLVDALFGTGLDRPLRSPALELVQAANASGTPIVAVDLPSGLDADTGEVLGAAVRARVTVTFVAPKLGFALAAGPEHCGRVVVAEIGIPRPLLEDPV